MFRFLILLVGTLAFLNVSSAERLLPWQKLIEQPDPAHTKSLEKLLDLPWHNSGGKEGTLSLSKKRGPWGGRYLTFHVKIDHHNDGAYPVGWPSFEVQPKPALDFTGYEAISYWIRCDTDLDRAMLIHFILWTNGVGRVNELITPFRPGRWVQVVRRIKDIPRIDKVDRIHFFLWEGDYRDGDEMTFKVGGFQLCNLKKVKKRLGAKEAAVGLWLGDRADNSERIVILNEEARSVPALLVFETGRDVSLKASDELRFKFHEVFTGKETFRSCQLGADVPCGTIARVRKSLDVVSLKPGYYLVVADVRRGGKSLVGGRVGSDDLYIRKHGESMTYTVLSIRTGMVMWIRDQLYGNIIGWAHAALPHVYDPLDKSTYMDFIRTYATATWKHTEGLEAGDTGLAFAAEAFRKAGDRTRCRFAEWLLEDSITHMIKHMQAPSGAARTTTNELAWGGYAKDWAKGGFSYDSNQIGEWMRAITYAIIYYSQIPEKRNRAKELCVAVRKAGDYLVAHATAEVNGIPHVIRHFRLREKPDGSVERQLYHQEGRQCDVYVGRALAGLSYCAYAMELLGEKVPDAWWPVMENTVKWTDRKMKPNGWFDWQCGDEVEGGCHTYLGNIYIGEGVFGVYLASKLAGREESAREAARVTRRAYHYVTDDCWIKGRKFSYPTEFWVGPYVYWLFTEYLDTIGPDPTFKNWLQSIDQTWSVKRQWKDFLDRPRNGAGYVGRASANGMLNVAILGYLGLKEMAEIGKPFHWRLKSLR